MLLRKLSLLLLLGLLLLPALLSPQPVQAAPAPVTLMLWNASPVVVPGAAFRSDGHTSTTVFFSFSGGYIRGNTSGCVMAPVYLPNYARINSIFASIYDNDATNNVWLDFYRLDNYTGTAELIGTVNSTGNSTTIQTPYDYLSSNNLVDYPTYSYYVATCMASADHRIYSVRVYFALNRVFMPGILR